MLLDNFVLGEEPPGFLKFSNTPLRVLINVNRNAALLRKGMEIATF
jgi:hypothetical protein